MNGISTSHNRLKAFLLLLVLGLFVGFTVPLAIAQNSDLDSELDEFGDEAFPDEDVDIDIDMIDQDIDSDADSDGIDLDSLPFNEDIGGDDDDEVGDGPIVEVIRDPAKIKEAEDIRRSERELKAKDLYFEGRAFYLKGEFEDAVGKFVSAQHLLKEASPTKYQVEQKQLDKVLGFTYEEWANDLSRTALENASLEAYENAIQRLQRAAQLSPKRVDDIKDKIKRLQQEQQLADIRQRSAPSEVDPGKAQRDTDIEVLTRQGEVLYHNQRYMDAREKFEQVMLKDIYNVTATKFMQLIFNRLEKNSQHRFDIMKTERIAEVGWKWADPVSPLVPPEAPIGSTTTISKSRGDTEGIRQKLAMNIPKIYFEDATIETVITKIKELSRVHDPDNQGLNMMLLNPEDVGAGDGGGGGGDDGFGDDFDDGFGDDFGDDFGGDDFGGDDGFGEDGEDGDFGEEIDDDEEFLGAEEFEEAPNHGIKSRRVTLDFDNIPLGEAIRYICRAARLKYRVEPHAVIIASEDTEFDDMETRFYSVEAGVIRQQATRGNARGIEDDDDDGGIIDEFTPLGFFERKGVEFPDKAKIDYDARTSKLIVTNTPDNLRLIEEILRELNKSPTQVMIESKFVEVAQIDINSLGFEWLLLGEPSGSLADPTNSTSDIFLDQGRHGELKIFKQTSGSEERISSGLRYAAGLATSNDRLIKFDTILGNVQYRTIIRALEQQQSADVLSAPKVTTLSGETAVIKMVEDRFFPSDWSEPTFQAGSSSGGTTTGASFTPAIPTFGGSTEVGVVMIVTPTVAADGYSIDLDLEPEVVQFLGFDDFSYEAVIEGQPVRATLQMPIISRRKVQTKVIVWDGETVVLGGMITETIQSINDKIPFLGKAPLIGRLFQSDATKNEKRNLLIFVTARLVNPAGQPIRTQEIRGLPDFGR